MMFRKIAVSDRNISKKRRVQSNFATSILREEFDCDDACTFNVMGAKVFGISKLEDKVSNHYLVKSFYGSINGSS